MYSGHAYSVNIVKQFFINSPSVKGFRFSAIHSQNLKLSFVTSSEFFLYVVKNTLLFLKRIFHLFNFVYSCLTNNFIKLKGVLSCVMAVNIIFFDNCNSILANKANNTLIMRNYKYFVHHSLLNTLPSQPIFCFLAVDILLALNQHKNIIPRTRKNIT